MLYIAGGIIHTMTDEKAFVGNILIADGKIRHIQSGKPDCPDGVTKIDAGNMHVYPGLIEAHCHIGICEDKTGSVNDDCNESTNPVTPALRAIDAINPMDSAFHNAVATGITSVMVGPGSANVIGGQFAFVKTYGRCIDDVTALFPAAIKVAFGENPKLTYGESGNMPFTRMGIAYMLRKALFSAAEYYKEKRNGGTQADFDLEAYIPVLERKIPLKVHAHRADDILTAIRIAKEFDIDITLDHCTQGHLIVDEIKASGFPAIVGPSMSSRNKPEVESLDFATATRLNEAGVTLALTTDHPVTRIQYLPLCAMLAVKEGMKPFEAIKAITINPAKICRVFDRVGSLETEKDADIIILDGELTDFYSKVNYTIADGKIIYRGGQIH